MTIPTNIPETPMVQPDYESIQESNEDSISSKSLQAFHHVLNNVLKIGEDEIVSFQKWMTHKGYDNFTDLRIDFYPELNHIHDYRVYGQKCGLKFGTMNKIRLFISWMSTRMTDTTVELYAEDLLALTYGDFNVLRTADLNRVSSGPISPPPGPTTHMTTLTGHTKGSTASESQVALNNFKKGNKRDTSTFPVFKNDLYYDTFQRSFLATIKAQGLYDVAYPDFDPDDGDHYDKQLFIEKQSFVYSVLVTSLQTDKGRE